MFSFTKKKNIIFFTKPPWNPGVYYWSGPLARKVCANSDLLRQFQGIFLVLFKAWWVVGSLELFFTTFSHSSSVWQEDFIKSARWPRNCGGYFQTWTQKAMQEQYLTTTHVRLLCSQTVYLTQAPCSPSIERSPSDTIATSSYWSANAALLPRVETT